MTTFVGTSFTDFGAQKRLRFRWCCGSALNPTNPNGLYLTDYTTVRHYDESNDDLSIVAGSDTQGGADDGIGSAAQLFDPVAVIVTTDGRSLYVSDSKNSQFDISIPAVK